VSLYASIKSFGAIPPSEFSEVLVHGEELLLVDAVGSERAVERAEYFLLYLYGI